MNTTDYLDPLNLINWFNPYDRAHLAAWKHLQDKGSWPEGFLPPYVKIGTLWSVGILNKLAQAFVEEKLRTP
jgi:hypothetical protein